jgi:SH3 domain-containing YSC84-like protein 1
MRENVAMVKVPRTKSIRRALAGTGLAALALAGCQSGTGGEQTMVDRAALTVSELMTQRVSDEPRKMLNRAKGVMICPRVFKAAIFFVGGEGGSCVLLARSGNGTWSYPAFYDIGSGSLGFQLGVQDSQLMLLIMTNRGLNAVMDSQVRLGANASVAVATVGGGVQGATTAAVGADIVAFAAARGLFGGVSLDGGVMSARTDENQAYYGQPLAARQIVLQMQGVNAGADPLREVLTRYGGIEGSYQGGPPGGYSPPTDQPSYQPPYQPPPSQQAYPPSYQPGPTGPANQPPSQPSYQPSYQPPRQPYQPAAPEYSPPPRSAAPGYALPQPQAGYQPPPGQYTYPPPSGTGPIQEQTLPPPGR